MDDAGRGHYASRRAGCAGRETHERKNPPETLTVVGVLKVGTDSIPSPFTPHLSLVAPAASLLAPPQR